MKDTTRTATFSSSQAHRLMTKDKKGTGLGAPALKYIKQIGYEIGLGRSISRDFSSVETSWGNFCERRVFKLVDTSYQNVTKQGRLFHETIKHYSGVPDFLKGFDTVCDCKAPFNMEKFMDKMVALRDYGDFKKEFPEDFWQLISNLVLLRSNGMQIDYIEAINYVPYLSEIADIRIDAEGDRTMKWLEWTTDDGLPWLPDGGKYKNLNAHRFRVMERDVDDWTDRITYCVDKLLGIETPEIIGTRLETPERKSIDQGPKRIAKLSELI